MKNAKRFASLLLALVMVFALTSTAFATQGSISDTKGTITINNTVKDTTYSIYKIFELQSFDTEKDAYSYTVPGAWINFVYGTGADYVSVDGTYITWKEGADPVGFAAAALAYAKENGIQSTATGTATADNEPVVFNNLVLGYYLVDSSLGALCALTTTAPAATINEKNASPTLVKEVKEGADWGNRNDVQIGETVEFRATITVQGEAKDYVMHDRMDDGLTYGSVTEVTKNGSPVLNDANKAYEVVSDPTDGDTFDVVFTEGFCGALQSGDVIVVTYTATLNVNAVAKVAEKNSAKLEYKDSNGETHNTELSETETFTWELPVFKYTLNGEDKTPLAGVTFALSTQKAIQIIRGVGDDRIKLVQMDGNTYRVATDDDENPLIEITTDATGRFKIVGLDSGTYYLHELAAPAGYNKLTAPIQIEIDANGIVSVITKNQQGEDVSTPVEEVEVENKTGSQLPTTGGMGTTIFYVVGSILLLGAAVLLITKKRMNAAA